MPKTKISEYSATANSNTDVASINIDEGCAPSGINNAIRAIMGHLKDFQSGTSNDPFTVGSSGSLTLSYGTANGVAYLNGSKVLTTGSALTFDGTNFGVTTIKSTTSLNLYAASAYEVNLYTGATNTARLSSNVNGIFTVGDVGSVAGIGTNYGTLGAWGTAGGGYRIYRGTGAGTSIAYLYADGTGVFLAGLENVPMVFSTSGEERARIDSSGSLVIGDTTANYRLDVKGSTGNGIAYRDGTVTAYMGTTGSNQMYSGTLTNHPLAFLTNATERARITSGGDLLVGTATGSNHYIAKAVAEGSDILGVISTTTNLQSAYFMGVSGSGENAAASAIGVRKNSSTSRSINAAGTINASGADYAEYMTKAGDFTIAKGDVVGIDAQGKLTNVFANAVSFVVKSTDPSYVGGDVWGSEEALGLTKPTDESTQAEKDAFNAALEAARQAVDRIAFAGQVPVNVMGATAGQYIIPVNDNGAIKGEAVSNPTFEQYQTAVGKVIAIESDGRAKIIVKVA